MPVIRYKWKKNALQKRAFFLGVVSIPVQLGPSSNFNVYVRTFVPE
jgi:hypothetical protein